MTLTMLAKKDQYCINAAIYNKCNDDKSNDNGCVCQLEGNTGSVVCAKG